MSTTSFLSDFMASRTFVAFDTETTGLWAPSHRIVEIAGVKFQPGSPEVEIFQSLVNPGMAIPAEVIDIHGITDEMVNGCRSAASVLEDFFAFCGESSILIAHNAMFDISFLHQELLRGDLTYDHQYILDTVDIFQRLYPGLPSYSLLGLISYFKIAATQEHRALSDAMYVYLLFKLACDKLGEVDSLQGLTERLTVYKLTDAATLVEELPPDFADLGLAIKRQIRVQIEYDHPTHKSQTRIISPRRVHKLGARYYVNAYCEVVKAERTFRLDRISSMRLLG